MRQEIQLGDHNDLTCAKRLRVLPRFVIALGRAEQKDPQVFPQFVGRRADQITDVLDEQEVERLVSKFWESTLNQRQLEVARATGRDLNGGCERGETFGISFGFDIADEHADTMIFPQTFRRLLQ
jgi:hypothetical protein